MMMRKLTINREEVLITDENLKNVSIWKVIIKWSSVANLIEL